MIDNISKFLIEQYSSDFAAWLLGESIPLTTINPTELNVEPVRADAVMLLQSSNVILHTEFQTAPDFTMPFRVTAINSLGCDHIGKTFLQQLT